MGDAIVKHVDARPAHEEAPPSGTAIVRPMRHVRAVRERHLQQLAERSQLDESRSARAWAWALSEAQIAPVTDLTGTLSSSLTTRSLKLERVYAEDVIDQVIRPWTAYSLPPPRYGEAVQLTITWLLGDSIAAPIDSIGEHR